jgi:hypothetical protein
MRVEEYRNLVAAEQTEHQLQLEVTRWLIANLGANVAWSAVDHAAKLSERQAADRQKRGVRRGLADYRFVLPPDGRSAEIELKRPIAASRQSPAQLAWQARVEGAGGLYVVCRSLPEVIDTLRGWGLVDLKVAA